MIKEIFSVITLSSLLASPLMADKATGSGPNPYSDCGIGAALFENRVAATISNVIWDVGTTALTSATASPETCRTQEAKAAAFILESYDDLLVESSHGEGQHFAALMNILEVESDQQNTLISSVRADMGTQIGQNNYLSLTQLERAELLYNSVMNAITTSS
jgi:hypothetical protein